MYVPLKITTDYSLLNSLIKINDLIDFLVKKNIYACGICDDNLGGVLEFYFACKKNNIKPIIGLNIKVLDKDIYLYAKNYTGYQNLIKVNENTEITLDDLLNLDNIIIILPKASWEYYKILRIKEDVYLGYQSPVELERIKNINKRVYIKNIKCLNANDNKYLKYLCMLKHDNTYEDDFAYIDTNINLGCLEKIVNDINIEIKRQDDIPVFHENSKEFLRTLAYKGLTKRLNNKLTQKYIDRLEHELSVIEKMGYVDYFLIVYDYVLYAKKNNILVGPGRGSAAGALLSYAIGITEIDPLKYDLLFERFLNPDRVSMPDIDIDFEDTKREEVINYVREKYGFDHVALGRTFSTFKSKLILRELAKVLKINPDLIDSFLKNISSSLSLKDNLKNEVVSKYINNYKELKKLYSIAIHLEGLKKNTSVHAAGVVISKYSLNTLIPVSKHNDEIITGVPLDNLENLGILKMDFLALRNLTLIHKVLDLIGKVNLNNIDFNDKQVLNLFAEGKTEGIFQFETPLLKNLAKRLKPDCFNDLVALLALGRPGPIVFADTFIKRKQKIEKVTYLDNSLENILKDTYGIILYQEQIMNILKDIAGYSYAEADIIRRAISKKKESVILKNKEEFLRKALSRGKSRDIAIKIYDDIARFASFGFNKSHSVSYAYLAYQMAYLKCYYPKEFIIVMLNENVSQDNYNLYINYLKSKNIKVLKPDINYSEKDFSIKNNNLIMPLWKIKNISKNIADNIVLNKEQKYSDFFEFVSITKDFTNKVILENLIKAGAFNSLKVNERTLMENLDQALNYAELDEGMGFIKKPVLIEYPEYDKTILRNNELSSFGFYVSNHPVLAYYKKDYVKLVDIEKKLFKRIKVLVYIENIKNIKTKKNEDMAFIKASDETSVFEFNVFSNKYYLLKDLKIYDIVELYGEVSKYYDKITFKVNDIRKVG